MGAVGSRVRNLDFFLLILRMHSFPCWNGVREKQLKEI
jgi:hypothetical protein